MLRGCFNLPSLIEAVNLTYAYNAGHDDAVKALTGVNLKVFDGEMLAITGQNGSGKSTMVRHFNGLLTPTSGSVTVKGMSVTEKANIPAIRKIVGMVFQNPDNQLVSSIVEEDIAFGPENLGLPPLEIKARVDWALKLLNIQDLREHPPNLLSEGQKQLVAIAGVLAMKPSCIVLDEPTAHLDPRGRRDVLENVLRLNRDEGITTVLLTHYMSEVVHCNRMVVMDRGEIKLEGTPREIFYRSEELTALGLDCPTIVQLSEGLRRNGIKLKNDIIETEELVQSLCQLK